MDEQCKEVFCENCKNFRPSKVEFLSGADKCAVGETRLYKDYERQFYYLITKASDKNKNNDCADYKEKNFLEKFSDIFY